ncbi:hypothetical protein HD806DRAFT_538743 [Xylariaceae sp. AK1471]|nr:hypothetical protein HD806DRAFT_538743 [Xylariaceae sp. AK1471]
MRTFALALAHLFNRIQKRTDLQPGASEKAEADLGSLLLPRLPENAENLLICYNNETLETFKTYANTLIDQYLDGTPDIHLSLTGLQLGPRLAHSTPSRCSATYQVAVAVVRPLRTFGWFKQNSREVAKTLEEDTVVQVVTTSDDNKPATARAKPVKKKVAEQWDDEETDREDDAVSTDAPGTTTLTMILHKWEEGEGLVNSFVAWPKRFDPSSILDDMP